jgi:hypothetical protein
MVALRQDHTMTKPNGKPRNRGGRPTNRHLLEKLQHENQRLRQLVAGRRLKESTWKQIDHLLELVAWLEDQTDPITARTYDGHSHNAEPPILPGIRLSDHPGNRTLYHPGTFAQDHLRWIDNQLEWIHDTVNSKLKGKEPPPQPAPPPRAETSHPDNPQNSQQPPTDSNP